MFLRWNGLAYDTYLAFFGFWLIVTGYLIFRSPFMPRIIGVLLVLDGLGCATYVSPPLGNALFPFILVAAGLGELPLIVWLLAVGVNAGRWNAGRWKVQAAVAGASLAARLALSESSEASWIVVVAKK